MKLPLVTNYKLNLDMNLHFKKYTWRAESTVTMRDLLKHFWMDPYMK